MFTKLTWKEISVYEILLPGEDLTELIIPPGEYLFDRLRIGTDDKPILSEEAASHLAKIHPIIIWSSKNYCISGIRTLFIISSIIPTAKITVGVLPSSLTINDLKKLVIADIWLTNVAFSAKSPPATLFTLKNRMPNKFLKELSPALDQKVVDFAKSVGVSAPTLYALQRKKRHDET